jgi:hypothetical protein
MKYAFAAIRNRHTERTAAPPCGPIQIPRKPIAFRAHARHSKRKEPLTPASESNETAGALQPEFDSKRAVTSAFVFWVSQPANGTENEALREVGLRRVNS